MSLGLIRMTQQIDAADVYVTIVRQQAASEHLQRRTFACAVVTKQAKDFAASQLQGYLMNDLLPAKTPRQVARGEGCFGVSVRQGEVSAWL